MYMFTEKGVRGGVFYIAKKYSKANNKYMKSYDDSKPSKYITYLGANNLYGWAMIQSLPQSEFKWLNQKQIDRFDVNSASKNSLPGYMLGIVLVYPDELHELHNDFPIVP